MLIAVTQRFLAELPPPHAIVEVGSHCGRSTVVFGSVLRALEADGRVYAVDPHDGVVGALDRGLRTGPSTLARFENNIEQARLRDVVVTVKQRPFEVAWERPIALLLIDGLHDYANVARDFHHFAPHVVTGGYVAFHDYADYFPGVKAFVNEQLGSGAWEPVVCVRSMIVLRKRPTGPGDRDHGAADGSRTASAAEPRAAPPAAVISAESPLVSGVVPAANGGNPAAPATHHEAAARPAPDRPDPGPRDPGGPIVSCLMPTYNRCLFVPQAVRCFLAQSYPHRELIVVDDGEEPACGAVASDASIRYVALDRRMSLGEKRNLAASLATGEILAHWDDDDWYGPGYLRGLVTALVRARPESLVGVSRYLVYLLSTGSLKICASRGPAGATFCYWRRLWERHPYRDVARAEDYFFLGDARPNVQGLQAPEAFAVVRHRHHTWAQENGRDVDCRLDALPAYHKTFADVVGPEAMAFYEHARRALFVDAAAAPAPPA